MSLKRVVIGAIGLIIILSALIIAITLFSSPSDQSKPLILQSIELRNKFNDPVAKANLITELNKAVSETDNPLITEEWTKLTGCLIEECSDDNYLNFIMITVSQQKDELLYPELINNLIIINRYWGGEMILEFSNAMSFANDKIASVRSRNIRKQWDDIIACNGECEDFNNLFFKLISSIVMLK